MDSVTIKAFAKINMRLEIREKRPDGYHGIETMFRGIRLHDELVVSGEGEGIKLECEGPFSRGLPGDSENLVWQAADLLRRSFPDRIRGAAIRLHKRIPVAAGLGGGSADAAAALLGLDRVYSLGLSKENLTYFAARLGADVAFCLAPLAAIGRGRGEDLEEMSPGLPLWVLLIKPPFGSATKDVYDRWDGTKTENCEKGSMTLLRKGMRENQPALIWENMVNDLEKPALLLDKRLTVYKARIEEEITALPGFRVDAGKAEGAGGGKVLLCGSGSAFGVFFAEKASARMLMERLQAIRSLVWTPAPGGSTEGESPRILLTRTLTAEDLACRMRDRKEE